VRLLISTAIAAVIAAAADLGIQELARRAFSVSPDFEPFNGTVVPYTVGGVVLAAIALLVVRRLARDPRRTYLWLSIAALVLSWIPDLALLVINEPGASVPAVAALMLMHAVAAAVVLAVLLPSATDAYHRVRR
jgi:hypothetical protein